MEGEAAVPRLNSEVSIEVAKLQVFRSRIFGI